MFMREVADVHRELYAENADLYGANVAAKIELCLAVTDSEYEAGLRARDAYREQMAELFDEVDLIVTSDAAPRRPAGRPGRARAPRAADAADVALQRARRTGARVALRPGRGRPTRLGTDRRAARRRRPRARCGRPARERTQALVGSCRQRDAVLARIGILLALATVALVPAAQSAVPSGAHRTARVPAARRRARARHVPADAVLRVGAVPACDELRLRARDQQDVRRPDGRVVDEQPEDAVARAGGGDPDRAALDDRQPLRALCPRPRTRRLAA